jgi:putative transposase
MKRKRHTEEQVIPIPKEAEAGPITADIARKYSISEQTFYPRKSQYGGMELSEARGLKRLVADQNLDIQILKDVSSKKL